MIQVKPKQKESPVSSGPHCKCACWMGDGFLHAEIVGDEYNCACFCIEPWVYEWQWFADMY